MKANLVLHNKKYLILTLLILFLQTFITIYTIPISEFPDAAYHINKIYNNTNDFHYKIHNFVLTQKNRIPTLSYNSIFSFAGNTTRYKYDKYDPFFLVLNQLLNCFLVSIYIVFLNFIIYSSKKIAFSDKEFLYKSSLLFVIWPQINYYLTTVSSDLLIILFQPIFVLLLLEKRIVLNFIFSILLAIFVDRNALTNIIFLLVYSCITIVFYRKSNDSPNKMIVLFVSFLVFLVVYQIINSPILKMISGTVYNNKVYNEGVSNGGLIIKLGAIFLSSLYLSGSMSFTTFYLIYAIYFVVILSIVIYVFRNKSNKFLFIALLSSLLTILLTLAIIPTLGQIKYYTYTILLIVFGIFVLMKRTINLKIFSFISISLFFLYCFSSIKAFINIYIV